MLTYTYHIMKPFSSSAYRIFSVPSQKKHHVNWLTCEIEALSAASAVRCRNAPEYHEPKCQFCNFILTTEDSVARSCPVKMRLPCTNRCACIQIQSEIHDLRRIHDHLKQGRRLSKKLTSLNEIKRYYLNDVISLCVHKADPLSPPTQ